MRNIFISIDRFGKVTTDIKQLGYSGEHNAASLIFSFDDAATEIYGGADYFRVIIDGHYSADLYLDNGLLNYSVPNECMCPPRVQCQLVGYMVENGEPKVIVKSQVFSFDVDRSEVPFKTIDTDPNILEQALEASRSSAEIAQQCAETATSAAATAQTMANTSQIYSVHSKQAAEIAVKSAEEVTKKNFELENLGNALKGFASGGVVAIKDVSPLPHTVLVKASGGGVGEELLTKTETLSTKGATVMLNTPAESVRVVVRGGAYCVGGLVPMVDGDDLTASDMKDELALWPTWSYGEAPGNYDLVYTVSGNVLSWSGTKYYTYDGVIEQSEAVSGSIELSTSGQKIIGFCQIYDLDEDNPFVESPEHDNLDMTVAVYESTPSVEVKVYGKNLLPSNFADLSTWNGSYFYLDLPVGNYTFTFELNAPEDMKSYGYLYVYKSNDNWATKTYVNSWGNPVIGDYVTKKFTFAVEEGYQYAFWMYALADKIQYYSDFQLEVGTSGTGYEPYIEPKTYTVTANGTAIPSIYPSMTFIPVTDGVELSVEYNRDINKAFAELYATLISVGGN